MTTTTDQVAVRVRASWRQAVAAVRRLVARVRDGLERRSAGDLSGCGGRFRHTRSPFRRATWGARS